MAPRGIVAAAITSLFAFELGKSGIENAESLVPTMFMVIIGTIAIYGLSALPLAKWLKIASPDPQGCLILGAHTCGRTIGKILKDKGFKVLMVDTNWENIKIARMEGLPTYYGSILSEYILNDIDLSGIGRLLALTQNEEVNSLAALYFSRLFGSNEVFQLAIEEKTAGQGKTVSKELRGQILFGSEFTFDYLTEKFSGNSTVKSTPITEEFDFDDFHNKYNGGTVIPLFLIRDRKYLKIFTDKQSPSPQPQDILVSLIIYESTEKSN
jgi:hypothetical protein